MISAVPYAVVSTAKRQFPHQIQEGTRPSSLVLNISPIVRTEIEIFSKLGVEQAKYEIKLCSLASAIIMSIMSPVSLEP